MSNEISSALIGVGGALFAVVLSGILRTGRGERLHPGKLREYLMIRDASVDLDHKQREQLDFEIAWSTARTLGNPEGYDEPMTPGENVAAMVFSVVTALLFFSAVRCRAVSV